MTFLRDRLVLIAVVLLFANSAVEGIAWGAEPTSVPAISAQQDLSLSLEDTPFILRSADGPLRRILVRTMKDGQAVPTQGALDVALGNYRKTHLVQNGALVDGAFELRVPEPAGFVTLKAGFSITGGRKLSAELSIGPARHWTFYMTPHTHYDIGFTEPQPEVMDRLSADMDTAVEYCRQTADWPEESRYRWTIEVTSLFRNYADRRSPEQVGRLLDLIRQNRIELCGYYLNMPTELVGHEELIRCLYYAEHLRRAHGVTIDTAMINDVPGYAWPLPQLFTEFGIRRVAFRANFHRGQFLWHRPGAVERPFYWEGPAGHKLFVWYTDAYREGNFFRPEGLHEKEFLDVIRRNEAAGTRVDHIQLRMGGDNLAPELNTSRNARAFNEKYLWPRIRVATNREFLELLENQYGTQAKTYRGDIPSWWADGPASSAQETGMNRLAHDRLVAAEALWTLLKITQRGTEYPHARIEHAYDRMIHFDEHTWGSNVSIDKPDSQEARVQWEWKARCARDAAKLTDDLFQEAINMLSAPLSPAGEHSVAVWNTLSWPRTDVVEVPLRGTPLEGAPGLTVADGKTGRKVAAQLDPDGKTAWFVAKDVPALSCAIYTLERQSSVPAREPASTRMENAYYSLDIAETGLWSGWMDKETGRQLVDLRYSPYNMNWPVFETPVGGRKAIDAKQPFKLDRTTAPVGKLLSRNKGAVFTECISETTLPTCPRIRQTVRLYQDLKCIDIINTVTKDLNYDPEIVYFAFPFDVPSPRFRLQIADATMEPGADQLTYTCNEFYSIQQWADVHGPAGGVIFVPLEAPLVVLSRMNAYKRADHIDFDLGHIYSMVMNNTWTTNFKAGQDGELTFRYRLTTYAGRQDPLAATHFAWQPFHPLRPVWLTGRGKEREQPPLDAPLRFEGDPLVLSGLKLAEDGKSVIVRLLEVRGAPARCTLRLNVPGVTVRRAFQADVVERPGRELPSQNNAVSIEVKANQIATLGLVLE